MTEEASEAGRPRRAPRPTAPRKRAKAGGSDYTAASIQVLEGLEAVRKRRACTSARPTSAACTTSSGRSSTTRSTRRWPATPRRIKVTIKRRRRRSSSRTTAAACPSASTRPARTRSRSSTPSSTPAASSAAAATRSPAACTASASASSTPCPRGCASSRRATGTSGRRSTSAASRRARSRRSGRRAARRGTTTSFRADPEMFETIDYSFETDQPAPARVGLPQQGRLDHAHRRAERPRALVLLRGRPPVLRAAPQPEQGGPPPAADLRRAPRGRHGRRGRPPVQRLVHRERARLRQQHQHGRRRHARHRLPRGPDELAQRLGAPRERPQGRRQRTSPATTSARA